MKIYGD